MSGAGSRKRQFPMTEVCSVSVCVCVMHACPAVTFSGVECRVRVLETNKMPSPDNGNGSPDYQYYPGSHKFLPVRLTQTWLISSLQCNAGQTRGLGGRNKRLCLRAHGRDGPRLAKQTSPPTTSTTPSPTPSAQNTFGPAANQHAQVYLSPRKTQ